MKKGVKYLLGATLIGGGLLVAAASAGATPESFGGFGGGGAYEAGAEPYIGSPDSPFFNFGFGEQTEPDDPFGNLFTPAQSDAALKKNLSIAAPSTDPIRFPSNQIGYAPNFTSADGAQVYVDPSGVVHEPNFTSAYGIPLFVTQGSNQDAARQPNKFEIASYEKTKYRQSKKASKSTLRSVPYDSAYDKPTAIGSTPSGGVITQGSVPAIDPKKKLRVTVIPK